MDASDLDIILFALDKDKRYYSYNEIASLLPHYQPYNKPEILAAITKLKKDGFIDEDDARIEDKYHITFDGIILARLGGYAQREKDIKTERCRQTLALWLTAIGTAAAGLYGLWEITKAIYKMIFVCG